ncbi:MAG TPA: type II toxin-antitoxin system VapC family toxin [Allosphingosinicella sp.]|jgi:predicted nucleic acid-binding protein
MPLVVDASVAVKFLVREPGNDQARRLLSIPDPLIAPDWLLVEAANTFWKKVKRSELLADHAVQHLQDLPEFFELLYPASDLIEDAFRWSIGLRHPVYDCIYLALAEREGCKLVTADEKFAAALARAGLSEKVEAF